MKRVLILIVAMALLSFTFASCNHNIEAEAPYKVYTIEELKLNDMEQFTHKNSDECEEIGSEKTISFMGTEYEGICYEHRLYRAKGEEEYLYRTENGVTFTWDAVFGCLTALNLSDEKVNSEEELKLTEEQYIEKAKSILPHISKTPIEQYTKIYTKSSKPNEVHFEARLETLAIEDTEYEKYKYFKTTDVVTINLDADGNFVSFSAGSIDIFKDFKLSDTFINDLANSIEKKIDELYKDSKKNSEVLMFYFEESTIRVIDGNVYCPIKGDVYVYENWKHKGDSDNIIHEITGEGVPEPTIETVKLYVKIGELTPDA